VVDKVGQWMGVGIIARDHEGQIISMLTDSRSFIVDPTSAKALAAWKLAEFCNTMAFQ
jgi:hypothetical protein